MLVVVSVRVRNALWGALNKNENRLHTYGRLFNHTYTIGLCLCVCVYFLKYVSIYNDLPLVMTYKSVLIITYSGNPRTI